MNLEKLVRPRKTRKTQNKLIRCINEATHPLGEDIQLGIFLNIFVLFVFFVDQLWFLE